MHKILLIEDGDSEYKELCEIFKDGAEIIAAGDVKEGRSKLDEDEDIAAVLINVPSRIPGVREFIDYIVQNNSFIKSIPIIILTGDSYAEEDLGFLGGPVADCIRTPLNARILKNRLNNAIKFFNSASFTEFSEMLKALPSNIYLKDEKARYVFATQTWGHVDTGGDPNWTIKGKTDLDIRKDKANAKLAMESDLKIIREKKGTSYIIEEHIGKQEFLQLIKEPLFYEDGRVKGIIALINNVTEQELMRRELRERSITDNLTGIYNRSYYDEYIHMLTDDIRYPLTIISADCDNLKMINDTYGHMVGDEYIRMSVTLMRTAIPESGIIFRTGGDEFVIFLPGVDEASALEMIDEMNKNAETYQVKGHPLSVSFGVSSILSPGGSVNDYLKLSDDNMYKNKQEKKAGRKD